MSNEDDFDPPASLGTALSEANDEDDDGLGDDVNVEDLGIDLSSLRLPDSNVLGRAKPKPTLTTNTEQEKRGVGRPAHEDEGLFAWCEQFNYAPGIDYLRLERLHPKVWAGLPIGGFITDLYEPIDEHWLSDHWGGGSYAVTSYQRDNTGRTRKGKVYTIEISGMPKAYMGQDGKPHPLHDERSSNDPYSSKRSADVLKRRMGMGKLRGFGSAWDDEDDSEAMDSPSLFPRRQNVDAPLQDATKMYQALQENKRSETEALGVLREAQKDVQEQMQRTSEQQAIMYRQLLEQQKEELARAREEQRSLAENSSAPFRDMLQFFMAKGQDTNSRDSLEALRDAHDRALKTVSSEHSKHLDELRRSFETRLSSLNDELNRQRLEYSQSVERIRLDYMEKERSAKDEGFRTYQAQLETMRSQSADLRERQRDELANLTREKNEMISTLRQELSELRSNLLHKESEARTSVLEREHALRQEFLERENKLARQIEKLQTDARTEKLEIRSQFQEEFREKLENFKETLLATYEAKLDSERSRAESTLIAKQKELEAEKAKIEAMLHTKEHEFEIKLDAYQKSQREAEKLELERKRLIDEASQRERETQRLIWDTTQKSQDALTRASLEQLNARLDESRAEIKRLERENTRLVSQAEPTDPFQQLERLGEIKQKLKSHGFITEEEIPKNIDNEDDTESKKEEAPKDLLGKIVHYGPQILGPILQRVDQATSIAQASLEQQKLESAKRSREEVAEQQRQLQQQQAAAQSHEETMRARRELLLQKRLEREAAIEAEQQAFVEQEQRFVQQDRLRNAAQFLAERRSPAPSPSPSQSAPLTDTPNSIVDDVNFVDKELKVSNVFTTNTEAVVIETEASLPTTTKESSSMAEDPYKKLADYLNESIQAKKTAESMANELRFARLTNMFSAEAMNTVLSRDFEELIAQLATYHSSLHTPRARATLTALLNLLKK